MLSPYRVTVISEDSRSRYGLLFGGLFFFPPEDFSSLFDDDFYFSGSSFPLWLDYAAGVIVRVLLRASSSMVAERGVI